MDLQSVPSQHEHPWPHVTGSVEQTEPSRRNRPAIGHRLEHCIDSCFLFPVGRGSCPEATPLLSYEPNFQQDPPPLVVISGSGSVCPRWQDMAANRPTPRTLFTHLHRTA